MCRAGVITNDFNVRQLGILNKSTGMRNLLYFPAIHRIYQVKEKKNTSVVTEDWISLLWAKQNGLGYMITAEG